jgi:hypothetical protein
MDTTNQFAIEQEINLQQRTGRTFFANFSVGAFLRRSGIGKPKGASPSGDAAGSSCLITGVIVTIFSWVKDTGGHQFLSRQ